MVYIYIYIYKVFASASCREAFGTSRHGSVCPPPPPCETPWSCKPMPWVVPPVGGSCRGGAPKCVNLAGLGLFPPVRTPGAPRTPGPFLGRPPLLSISQKPSFLLSCPRAGPAAEGTRASVYNLFRPLCCPGATCNAPPNLRARMSVSFSGRCTSTLSKQGSEPSQNHKE